MKISRLTMKKNDYQVDEDDDTYNETSDEELSHYKHSLSIAHCVTTSKNSYEWHGFKKFQSEVHDVKIGLFLIRRFEGTRKVLKLKFLVIFCILMIFKLLIYDKISKFEARNIFFL